MTLRVSVSCEVKGVLPAGKGSSITTGLGKDLGCARQELACCILPFPLWDRDDVEGSPVQQQWGG
jgi:hypothetical protein